MFHLALWFQAVAGKSASEAGLGLLPGILGSVCGSLLGGLIMQKTGKYYWLTVSTAALMVVGNVLVVAFTGAYMISVLGASIVSAYFKTKDFMFNLQTSSCFVGHRKW